MKAPRAKPPRPLPLVEPATESDVPAIAALLRRSPGTVTVPPGRLAASLHRYRVIRQAGRTVATAALQPASGDRLELRSVAVDDEFGGLGLGSYLVRAMQYEAWMRGRRLLCVTTSPGFFARLGFTRAPQLAVRARRVGRRRPDGAGRVVMTWRPSDSGERTEDVPILLRRSA
jgi:N-acetylglutamate synthase-like GNAT family acetyltransferase